MIAEFQRGLARTTRFSGREAPAAFWPYAFVVLVLALLAIGACLALLARLESGPDFAGLSLWLGIAAVLVVALLAAAVTRRLHDLDETGLWGLMPLPFLAIDIVGFPRALSYFAQQIADPWLFAGLFANNILYLATLGALLAMLSRDGVPGPNRHGPVPGLWDFSPTA